MSKEAIIFSIDAGSSMDEKFIDSESSRLKIALECLKLTLQQKLFNNSSHQIGFALFGQNDGDSDDGNNTLLRPISKPDLDFVRKVVALSEITLGNQKVGGDIFSAIDFMTERLVDNCGKLKYNKRAFLFTNGRGKTNIKQRDFTSIVSQIKKNDIKLNIIPMDFMETYDFETNEIDNEIFAHPIQEQNSQLLMKLRQLCPENIQIFPASLAIELYKKFRKRDTNPVALFKGNFEIAPNMEIEVCTYKAIRKQTLKSLSKFDLTAPFDPEVKKEKQIQIDINYILEGDSQGNLVDKQNVINAYPYGPNIVPMSEAFEKESKIFQEKNFKLLGFVDSEKIPRHCFLSGVDIVVPQKDNLVSRKLFSAFIYSMIVQKKYAIARYIPRNSKRGVIPRMVVLIPYRSPQRQMFYLTDLPTIEGVKDYPFNSLKKSTQKQQEFVQTLVDKMMLVSGQNGKERQEAKIQNMFNPYRQYFYQTLFHRALEEGQQNAIPELDDVTRKYITPEAKTFINTESEMPKIKKQFKLKVVQINKIKQKEKKLIIWKDVLTGQLSDTYSFQQIPQQMGQQIGKKFTLQTEDDDKFNPSQPILSFRKMINNNKKDLVNQALTELSAYIQKRGHDSSTSDSELSHLIQCAKQIRKACMQQRQIQFWDQWFSHAQTTLPYNLYHLMKINGLGFINKSNQQLFKPDIFEMKPISLQVDDLD